MKAVLNRYICKCEQNAKGMDGIVDMADMFEWGR